MKSEANELNIIMKVNLKAEHSPYWLCLTETQDGVFMEDIFTEKNKEPAMYLGTWDAAILAARHALNQWENRIEGFENYITIEDVGWTDIVIAFSTLSKLYPSEAEHLKKLLSGCKNFDTGKSWIEGSSRYLRVLAVEDRVLLEVSQNLPSIPSLIHQCVSFEEEMGLSEDLIEEITGELEDYPAFERTVTVKELLPRNTPFEKIMERIAILEQRVEARLDESRGICRTITQNYLKGSLSVFSVIVKVPNVMQRGLIVSARTTAELLEKISQQVNLGPDATVMYSQILTDQDCAVNHNELHWQSFMGKKHHFQWENISFSDEIWEQDGKLNFYVPIIFDYVEILGPEYGLLDEDSSLNVYASYDLKQNEISEELSIVIRYAEGPDESRKYHLTARERDMFLRKMNLYCEEQTGKDLAHWHEA